MAQSPDHNPTAISTADAEPVDAVFDALELLNRCLGHVEFAERLLASFDKRWPDDTARLADLAGCGDASAFAGLAHQLKGASANVSAPSLASACAKVELAGREGRLAEAVGLLHDLEAEWRRFQRARTTLRGVAPTSTPRAARISPQ